MLDEASEIGQVGFGRAFWALANNADNTVSLVSYEIGVNQT